LATPNYSYEKRQRELAKKRKNEEKRQRKLNGIQGGPDDTEAPHDGGGQPPTEAPDTQQSPKPDNP
jgi:hypothetical protein